MVGRVARSGDHDQRTNGVPVGDAAVHVAARGRHRGGPGPRAQRSHGLGVVGVVVGEQDPAQPAPPRHLGGHRRDVLRQRRAGVDRVGGISPHHPRVGAVQRERPRVVGAQARHVVALDRIHQKSGPTE